MNLGRATAVNEPKDKNLKDNIGEETCLFLSALCVLPFYFFLSVAPQAHLLTPNVHFSHSS